MKFELTANLGLSQEAFHQLQVGRQTSETSIAYHQLTKRVIAEIKLVLKSIKMNHYLYNIDKQELISETITKFWLELPRLKYENLSGWLFRTYKNAWIDAKRRDKKIQLQADFNMLELECDREQEQSLYYNKALQVQVINHFLMHLTENQRFTFVQNKLENIGVQVLGKELGIVPNTLSQRHARILDELRNYTQIYKCLYLND